MMLKQTFIIFAILTGLALSSPVVNRPMAVDYETLGGHFEGDMILPEGFDPTKSLDGRGVAIFGPRQWPNNEVPYDLALITDAGQRTMIETAMRIIENATSTAIAGSTARKTCVKFRPKTSSDTTFLTVQTGTGCSASVGYFAGSRRMTLQASGCFRSGIIQHELLHVLGFYHEQSRPDRDEHITVNFANMQTGKEHNFNKYAWGVSVTNLNSNYDYGSIMHYGATSFSANRQPTIESKVKGVTMGQRDKMSQIDIDEVRAYYKCT